MNPGSKPKGERCPATSKRTGGRCKQVVIGGGPCRMHGGAAPQVAAARESRVLAAQASNGGFLTQERSPAQALLAAVKDADGVTQALKQSMAGGHLDPLVLDTLGDWIDRVGRLAKVVLDARVEEREAAIEEKQIKQITTGINRVFDRLGIVGEQRDLAARITAEEFRRLAREEAEGRW